MYGIAVHAVVYVFDGTGALLASSRDAAHGVLLPFEMAPTEPCARESLEKGWRKVPLHMNVAPSPPLSPYEHASWRGFLVRERRLWLLLLWVLGADELRNGNRLFVCIRRKGRE